MITKYTTQEVLIQSKNMLEHASTEKVRVERLQKDILKLTVN